jgi:carbonic anhydrase/acetyltransferase-like protein (isoleucine patch superfamily)
MFRRLIGKIASAYVWLRSSLTARVWLRRCDTVGANTRTFWRPHIHNRGRITIGGGVRLNSHWAPVELITGPDGVIDIADGVYINYGTLIAAERRVRIGANVMIGNYSIVGDTDVPGFADSPRAPRLDAREIEIGEGAWLAARVTVLPGARIGAGAVIAAGSVVAGEIPANAIAGGIPARVLRAAPSRTDDAAKHAEVPEPSGSIR